MRTERIPNSASLCPRERGGKSALLKKKESLEILQKRYGCILQKIIPMARNYIEEASRKDKIEVAILP